MRFTFSRSECPKCSSTEIRKSRKRNVIEVALSVVVIPCRCYACDLRFFRPRVYRRPPNWPKLWLRKSASSR